MRKRMALHTEGAQASAASDGRSGRSRASAVQENRRIRTDRTPAIRRLERQARRRGSPCSKTNSGDKDRAANQRARAPISSVPALNGKTHSQEKRSHGSAQN